jgi:predicted alpha-1,6-mannanase (GH76 family)
MKNVKEKITNREYRELALTSLNDAGNAVANFIIAKTQDDIPKRLEKIEKMHELIMELNALVK